MLAVGKVTVPALVSSASEFEKGLKIVCLLSLINPGGSVTTKTIV